MSFYKKFQSPRSALKKLGLTIPFFSILSSSIYTSSFADNLDLINPKLIAQNNNDIDSQDNTQQQLTEKIDPTDEVAGGVGEKGHKAPKYAVLPTGKTLPKGIFKVDVPVAYTFGNESFDSNGKRINMGLDMKRWMTGILLQYGLSNTVSVGVGIPLTASYQLGMNGNLIAANSEMYSRYYNHVLNDLATQLSQNGGALCGGNATVSNCANYINTGGNLSNSASIYTTLPTGERFTFNSASPLSSQIRNLLLTASQPTNGATGLGDIQFGILWSIISEESPLRHVPIYFSLGGGLRVPTGKFNIVSAMRATGGDGTLITGGGTYDAILRWNLDYVAVPGVILSWQHMAEYSFTKAKLGRTSMSDNTSFNTADPNVDNGSNGHGDGQGNDLLFWRKGLHHIGFIQAAWGLGNVSNDLKWWGLYTQAKYNIAAKSYLNGQPIYTFGDQFYLGDSSMHPDHGYEQYYSAVVGTKVSGLPYRIPGEFSAEFEYPVYGFNRMVAPMNTKGTFTVYF
ncbi:hypothetical protein [Silvanigrella aquatica]|uniref:Uncharacterized protein n=1 Tax=Silvanigrella aquatica TaxID=1915309 RepID=A0A1L4D1D9_9BACT|nr:hypothetical protein [Silvanigrella aquatica]APJ04008.1 hypothetical protein AXG55_08850 [Silvanigrella aquatica]